MFLYTLISSFAYNIVFNVKLLEDRLGDIFLIDLDCKENMKKLI